MLQKILLMIFFFFSIGRGSCGQLARALYDFSARNPDELSILAGDELYVSTFSYVILIGDELYVSTYNT